MNEPSIAYFSMEIALDPAIPTYAGGLGILSGDTIRSAADLKVPMVGVTMLHRKGYLRQRLDASGWQQEEPCECKVEDFLKEMPQRVTVQVEGRTVHVRAWKYEVKGLSDSIVPVLLLDADLPENSEWDRALTHYLYGDGQLYRLCQEVILGIGGLRMLRALGYLKLQRFHMNEGHASLLGLELLDERARGDGRNIFNHADVEAVRAQCVFTTHTPVPAGHDQFPLDLVGRVLGRSDIFAMKEVFCCEGVLNLTYLALNLSHYVNGVAKKHGEVTQLMFARYSIDSITNGVHAATWTSPPFQELFDRHIPGWRKDNFSLRFAHSLPREEVWVAHTAAKHALIDHVNRVSNAGMDANALTLGFARRSTPYKRGNLLVSDMGRLKAIASRAGALQVIYAGKAHPNDRGGKELIQRIVQIRDSLKPDIKLVYLENYDMEQARLITSGVDVRLNTPQPPLEASGTSGMKAALNGVPSLSILDMALSELSAEQDALFEVEEALKRILNGTYGLCEETGKPIPEERLKAIPWTRFAREVEARLENDGAVKRPHLGALGSVREELSGDLEESESEEEKQPPAAEDESLRKVPPPAPPTRPRTAAPKKTQSR